MKIHLQYQDQLLSFEFDPKTQTIQYQNGTAAPISFQAIPLSTSTTSQLWLINQKPVEIFLTQNQNWTTGVQHRGEFFELKRTSPSGDGQSSQGGMSQRQGKVRSVMPGKIVETMVKAGDRVEMHQTLLVMEAMKMQNEIKAPMRGKIRDLAVQVGQSVESHTLLVEIEALGSIDDKS